MFYLIKASPAQPPEAGASRPPSVGCRKPHSPSHALRLTASPLAPGRPPQDPSSFPILFCFQPSRNVLPGLEQSSLLPNWICPMGFSGSPSNVAAPLQSDSILHLDSPYNITHSPHPCCLCVYHFHKTMGSFYLMVIETLAPKNYVTYLSSGSLS